MRISTGQTFQQGMDAILEQQTRLARTQLQLSTGRRMLTPADDPPATARAMGLQQAIEATRQFQSNADAAAGRLGLEDNVLAGVVNVLQRVREIAIQANSGALTDQDRSAIGAEVQQRLQELLSLANSRDGAGEYLFAGFQGQTQPFVQSASGKVDYNGDQGQRLLQISPMRQIAVGDSGHAVFRAMPTGNGTFMADAGVHNGTGIISTGSVIDATLYLGHRYTITFDTTSPPTTFTVTDKTEQPPSLVDGGLYTDGAAIEFDGIQVTISGQPADGDTFAIEPSKEQDIFTTLVNLVNTLETPVNNGPSASRLAQGISRSLSDIDQAISNIDTVRASVGARLSAIDSQKEVNDGATLQFQQTLSEVQDLDYIEAISRLNRDLLGLQAAQQTFVKVQGLSLFDFLR
jgi:flagellar hook-associated protein 3 FlgL